jgi:hypothetical protein
MILVFKTTVANNEFLEKVASLLNTIQPVSKWNFDFEDCDNILRIETKSNISAQVVSYLSSLGFNCEELTD